MTTLFFAYSHRDEDLRNELETHLSTLRRQGIIETWHDRRIQPGEVWDKAISSQLDSADIVLLLVSAYFIESDYCYEKELARAIERHEQGTARVIPVILRPCDWTSLPFGKLQAVPRDGKPVSKFADPHEGFAEIAKAVRAVAKQLRPHVPHRSAGSRVTHDSNDEGRSRGPRSSNLRVKISPTPEEKDRFIAQAFEYMARYFEGSLEELRSRTGKLTTNFERVDSRHFIATVYLDGRRAAQATIWRASGKFVSGDIAYTDGAQLGDSTTNDSLNAKDDGYTLFFEPSGFGFFPGEHDKPLSMEGAAEHFWRRFIQPLQ